MKNALRIILVMSVIGIISATALALIYQRVEPRVEAHRAEALRKAVLGVVPGAYQYREVKITDDVSYFEVTGEDENLLGYALPGQGLGYGGVIRLMVGVTTDFQKTTGLAILENLETPGLGSRITEEPFLKQFRDLALLPKLILVKGTPSEPSEVSSVTGATISSQAVVDITNQAVSFYRDKVSSGTENNLEAERQEKSSP